MSASSPASHTGSAGPSAVSRRVRSRIAASYRFTRWPWPGCSANTSRSRKRRRLPLLSLNKRSIAGVSHTKASQSLSAVAVAAAPFTRTSRRSGAAAAVPVPICTSPSAEIRWAATLHPPGPSCRAASDSGAPRKPRPGASNEIASNMLVLPAPLSPVITTSPGPAVIVAWAWLRKSVRVRRVIAVTESAADAGHCRNGDREWAASDHRAAPPHRRGWPA